MKRLILKHRLLTRWCHWINAAALAVMIWSGLLIYWSNNIYGIRIGDHTVMRLFPPGWFDRFGLGHRLAEGMAWHFAFMWLFTLNGVIYVLYTAVSGEWRHLLPERRSWRDAFLVLLHDLHLRKALPPQGRYNAAQRISYTGIIVMGAGSVVSGLAIYRPVQFRWLTALLGGYEWARFEHFWLMIGYVLFTIVHLIQVIRAGWGNFRSIIAGVESVDAGSTGVNAPLATEVTP